MPKLTAQDIERLSKEIANKLGFDWEAISDKQQEDFRTTIRFMYKTDIVYKVN